MNSDHEPVQGPTPATVEDLGHAIHEVSAAKHGYGERDLQTAYAIERAALRSFTASLPQAEPEAEAG
jgi:hypothetical protein